MTRFAIAAVVLVGCATPGAKDSETLADTVRSFNESVRWGRYDRAALRLPTKQRPTAIDEWDERSKDLKITDWELVKIDPHGEREARAQIKVSWYKDSEQILRETQAVQTWERHGKNWFLVDETRLRGASMPGLPDGKGTR